MKIRNKITAKNAKWVLRFYPPFFFNRIFITNVSEDFTEVNVKIKKSILNLNMAKTIFGGTMFSAADPFIAIMFWQIFSKRFDKNIIVWLKGAEIIYKKPAISDVFINFKITEDDIFNAKHDLSKKGKHVAEHTVELKGAKGQVFAIVKLKSYLANKPKK